MNRTYPTNSRTHNRVDRYGLIGLCVLCASIPFIQPPLAQAQPAMAGSFLSGRALVIRNARIVDGAGRVIPKADILIRGKRIVAIGEKVKAPFLARHIDAAGRTITPGLIDGWSALGRVGRNGGGDPTTNAWDAFDRYDREAFREALRHGVTTVYLGPGGGGGINGTGVVVQLVPQEGHTAGVALDGTGVLAINLGSSAKAIKRASTFQGIRQSFRKAVEYRKALEDYEEDLKEYIEKLEERRDESDADESKEESKGESEGEVDDDEDAPSDDAPAPEDKPEPTPTPKPTPDRRAARGGTPRLADNGDDGDENGDKPGKNGDEDNGDGEEKEDEDELKKPQQPARDPASDVLLRAIDHELLVRITAHRSADILNALALGKEFNLDIVLEGATDAYLHAEALADADVPVVLGAVSRSGVFQDNEFRRHTAHSAALLGKAGVRWIVGSGAASPQSSRFVGFNTQLAVGHAAGDMDWLSRVTRDAANLLGVANVTGRIARGLQADLVIWNGDPADPGSTVERVIVQGKVAYVADSNVAGGGR